MDQQTMDFFDAVLSANGPCDPLTLNFAEIVADEVFVGESSDEVYIQAVISHYLAKTTKTFASSERAALFAKVIREMWLAENYKIRFADEMITIWKVKQVYSHLSEIYGTDPYSKLEWYLSMCPFS